MPPALLNLLRGLREDRFFLVLFKHTPVRDNYICNRVVQNKFRLS